VERSCFLCNGKVEVLDRTTWSLPNLPPTELGFGLCIECGLVLQSPSMSPDRMSAWYRDQAVYTNPGRAGQPHPRKVRGTTRLLRSVEHSLGRPAESVFQVGCSDGYALSRFREAGATEVVGLDPSPASAAVARERYQLDVRVGTIEELAELPRCELWLLTHVLEHLFDPLAVLKRARSAKPDWLVVEVPLFERPDELPPGYLSFEHLNYFTEDSLVRLLARAGFEVLSLDKQYADDIYPVVAVVARAGESSASEAMPGERKRARLCLDRTLERERTAWARIDQLLADQIGEPQRLFLWGGGVFASQLLANTRLEALHPLTGILDSSDQRWGSSLGEHRVLQPASAELGPGDCVVISSYASELEIWNALAAERERGVRVLRLHSSLPTRTPESTP